MQPQKIKIIKGILLEQLGKQREAIRLVNEELKNINSKNPSFVLTLMLIRMVSYYGIRQYKKYKKDFFSLLDNPEYSQLFEYGYLLRGGELAVSLTESLPYLLQSISFFEKFGETHQAAISRITYGVHLGLVGRLAEATQQFNLAQEELKDSQTEKHILLNDQAVVLLFKKSTDKKVALMLKQALETADLDFDRITILINYMVLMDWRNDHAEMLKTIKGIEKILLNPSFADKEIIRAAYFDIYKYYQKIGKNDLAEKYRRKIDALKLPLTPIWNYFLHDKPISLADEEYFSSTIDRAIGYITCWNIDINNILERYK